MANTTIIEQQICGIFSKQPCWMIDPLAAELNYSIPSVRRFLAVMGYYSSFTHNGKWYTLKSIPSFNRNGIWFHKDIGFSKVGSLTNTLVALTDKSHAGVTAEQIGETLHCRCHTLMVQLCRKQKLQRQKVGRSFIYLSAVPHTADRQQQSRNSQDQHPQLPAEIAVLILVEYIQDPDAEFPKLAKTIKAKWKISVTVAQIEQLFRQYCLKKTMLTVV
jgi:predicted transcriptional regulator